MAKIIIEDLEPGITITVMADKVQYIITDGPDPGEEKPEDKGFKDLDLGARIRKVHDNQAPAIKNFQL